MIYLIRLYRLKNLEVWELRFPENDDVFCYLSITDTETNEGISIDIHSNVDLKKAVDFEELVTVVESLVNNMLLTIPSKINLFTHPIDRAIIPINPDEENFGSKESQILSYIDSNIKTKCLDMIEERTAIKIQSRINYNKFCQDQ
jgi:hypothetical protein